MNDFTVRSDSVDVEQIMEQIRARIREKRGVDYTEEQIRELADVKLEKVLEPRGIRSDLLEQFRKVQPAYQPPELPNFAFEDTTLYESHRAPIQWIRALLNPLLKLLFNPNPMIQALHIQSRLNAMAAGREATREAARREMDQLYYELIHNLVIETTRLSIEVKGLKMRVESLTGRLEFNERRARALESVVVYKPETDDEPAVEEPAEIPAVPGPSSRQLRRRRAPANAADGGGGGAGGGTDDRRSRRWAVTRRMNRRSLRASRARRRSPVRRPHRRHQPSPASRSEAGGRRSAVGPAINGGAELHARYVAEHLARHAEVEVLTTCASDYVTWRNEWPAGEDRVNDVRVRRFRVRIEREPHRFGRLSERVFEQPHSIADELQWLDAEGPTSPTLIDYIERHASTYDFLLFFSYRYYHAYHGARAAASRAVLVPTAERDAAIGLGIFPPLFRGVRALMYNSPEERSMIHAIAANEHVPGVIVGIGSDVPPSPQPNRFRQKYDLRTPFAVYVGRIDQNKGCQELFEYFEGYLRDVPGKLTLVLIGNSLLPIPASLRIRHLGFLDDTDKFDAMAAADLLIMPSYYESLSMVTLEAWALGRPVLANGKCDVLKGQCIRSNAGLYYESYLEFVETLHAFERNRWLIGTLGRNGRQFFRDNYDWAVIERKYLEMFERLTREPVARPMEPLPGWFARRRATLPPAEVAEAQVPTGPVVTSEDRPRPAATRVALAPSGQRFERASAPGDRRPHKRRGFDGRRRARRRP